MKNAQGVSISSQTYLESQEVHLSRKIFRNSGEANIAYQLEVIKLFPSFFSVDEGLKVGCSVSLKEVNEVLNDLEREKILGLNG